MELGTLLHNPKVPGSRRIHQPDTRASCSKSPSPHGALDLVLSDCFGDSMTMGRRKLLLGYQASLVLRAGCYKTYRYMDGNQLTT